MTTPALPGRPAYRSTLDCDACNGGDCRECGGTGVVDDEGDVFAVNELLAREVACDAGLSEGERRAMDDEEQRED